MKKTLMIILALVMALTMVFGLVSTASAAKPVPAGYYCLGNHYYRVSGDFMYWTDARNYAASQTLTIGNRVFYGHLVIITSARENAFLTSLISGGTNYWIGAYQPTSGPEPDGGWAWVDETVRWNYTNWANGEPNDSGGAEDYGVIYNNGTWNDSPSNIYRYYIVEYER